MATSGGAEAAASSQFLHVVGEHGEFTNQLLPFLNASGFADAGLQYSVVSVLGCQSSGKSTLLNFLFGTTFPVMNASEGRSQTTKGVYAASKTSDDRKQRVLVLDIEGVDSSERGEEAALWERRYSLFALALSEVLVVNLWMHDIGRKNAANLPLLKTVFELNLQLFQKRSGTKSLLLFVIRDHTPSTPVSRLQDQIRSDINKIWSDIMKPEDYASSQVTDFFDLDFVALAHKEFATQEFARGVDRLRDQFLNDSDPNYLLRKEYHKSVPIDGFPHYARTIWDVIVSNKDLDIPNEKQTMTVFRCSEISSELLQAASETNTTLSNRTKSADFVLSEQSALTLALDTTYALHSSLSTFDKRTQYYDREIVAQKRTELRSKILVELEKPYRLFLATALRSCFSTFSDQLHSAFPKDGSVMPKFASFTRSAIQKAMKSFTALAEKAADAENQWSFKDEVSQLTTEITLRVEGERNVQLEKLYEGAKTTVSQEISELASDVLNNPNKDMWNKLRNNVLMTVVHNQSEKLKHHLTEGFEATEEEINASTEFIATQAVSVLRQRLKETASNLEKILERHLEKSVRRGPDNMPRVWKSESQIRRVCSEIKYETMAILDLFFLERLDSSLDSVHVQIPTVAEPTLQFSYPQLPEGKESSALLSVSEVQQLFQRIDDWAEREYREAERLRVLSQPNTTIPWWMFIVIAVLGWNEFWAVISNPIYSLTLLIGGLVAIFYFLHHPALSMPIAVVKQTTGIDLKKYSIPGFTLSEDAHGRGAAASERVSSSSSDSDNDASVSSASSAASASSSGSTLSRRAGASSSKSPESVGAGPSSPSSSSSSSVKRKPAKAE